MMEINSIETFELTKYFGDVKAVDNINISIKQGEMFYIVGPDGVGKTTFIKVLCGIIQPTKGTAKISGFDLNSESEKIKKNIGYLSQKFSLYGDLTVNENIEFFADIHNIRNFQKRKQELLEFTRLEKFTNRLASRLSGGMKQKLALACTLIHTPKILFLDEPTTGVDPVSRRDFWKILSVLLKTGITIVISTPYLDEAERGTRIGLMNNGNFIIVDNLQNIKQKMQGIIIEFFCVEIRRAYKILKKIIDVTDVQIFGDKLNIIVPDENFDFKIIKNKLKKNNIDVLDYRIIPPSLENIFILLTKEKGAGNENNF